MNAEDVEPTADAGERLVRWLESLGWRSRLVPIARLGDLEEAVAGRHARGEIDDALYREQLAELSGGAAPRLAGARSIVVVAVPTPPMRVIFHWKGASLAAILPPTYVSYSRRMTSIQEVVIGWLERAGFRGLGARLPLKTLAVSSGLAEYGRNNVCYVPGMGSYLELAGVISDVPSPGDPWRPPRLLARCAGCQVCRDRCPTGAIGDDRVLLHAERCITLHNESEADFPEWIDSSWHECLFGCLRCQDRCPENGRVRNWLEDRGEFSEDETALLLERPDPASLPAPLAARLQRLGLSFDSRVIGRNLAALVAAREAARS